MAKMILIDCCELDRLATQLYTATRANSSYAGQFIRNNYTVLES